MDEKEILRLQSEIRDAEAGEARARSEAEGLLARIREAGQDPFAADNLAKLNDAYKVVDTHKERSANLRSVRDVNVTQQVDRAANGRKDEASTVALRFLQHAEYRNLVDSNRLRNGGRIDTNPVEVCERDAFLNGLRTRVFDNSTNVGSGLLTPDYTGKLVDILTRPVRLLDLITTGRTDTDTVDWIEENARTDAAAETSFGTALPESSYGFSHKQTTVKRVGHFVTATRGILADAGQSRTLIDGRLMDGLARRIESQVFSGDGIGENIKGILTYGSFPAQARGTDTQLDAVHKSMTKIRIATETGVEPRHILIHPTDYETVVLAKESTGGYLFGNPDTNNKPSIWGLTPVVTTLVSVGTPVIGDFSEAATLWSREGVSIAASDSHNDFFLKGYVAIKAETRLAFAVTRLAALCKITSF